MDVGYIAQLKKQIEKRGKKLESNDKNLYKQKEQPKKKEKENLKKNDKEEKGIKNVKKEKSNISKSINSSIQNQKNEINNNKNKKNSINYKDINNNSYNLNYTKNINNINNSNKNFTEKNTENSRKSVKEKENPKNLNNIINYNNNPRISTPLFFNGEPQKVENKINNNKYIINNKTNKNIIQISNKSKEIKKQNKKYLKDKRTKSFIKDSKNIIIIKLNLVDIFKNEKKKSNSTKNKNVKIDLTPKRKIKGRNKIHDNLEEIMKIDSYIDGIIKNNNLKIESRNEKQFPLPNGFRTQPTMVIKKPESEKLQIEEKKRFSVMENNSFLTIKLKSKNKYTKDDFEVVTFSGKGAYGTVMQAYLKNDPKKKLYAVKKLDINSLLSVNRLYQAYLENDILNELDSPYIVKVYGAFEAEGKIHLIMDYLSNGDLSYFININFPLKDDIIRFYSAEIVLFFEYMQNNKLIHRDLKPQNIMIDEKGHLKVIDFGTVRKQGYYYDKKEMKFKEEKPFEKMDSEDIKSLKKIVNQDEENDEDEDEENEQTRAKRSMTFVGTAEYISPEVIGDRPAEFGTDIWAFGVMLYQMYYNSTPFKAKTAYLTFRNIEKPQISFPNEEIPEEAKDLILKILVEDPKKRLGGGDPGSNSDLAHLKKHPFFKNIKWNNLHNTNPPGIKEYKFYESKKKTMNKEQGQTPNIYEVLGDKSLEKNKNIKIIKEGYIKKRTTWLYYEKRYIILDTTPRIIIKAVNDNSYYREIFLNKKCKILLVENNCFEIKTPEKTNRFKGIANDGNDWAGIISDAIDAYAKD